MIYMFKELLAAVEKTPQGGRSEWTRSLGRHHPSSWVEGGTGASASGLNPDSGRKSSRQTGDPPWRDRRGLAGGLHGGEGQGQERAKDFQGFGLKNRPRCHLLTGGAGREASGVKGGLSVRGQPAAAGRGQESREKWGHRQAQEGALWECEEPVRQGSGRGQGGVRGARGGQGNKGPGRDTPSPVTVTEDGGRGSTCSTRPGRRRRGAQPSWGRGVEEAGRAAWRPSPKRAGAVEPPCASGKASTGRS